MSTWLRNRTFQSLSKATQAQECWYVRACCFSAMCLLVDEGFYVCAQVLSEFTGSAQSLSGAIRVNPWNTEELANAILQALTMSRVERELRQHKVRVVSFQWLTPTSC